MKKYGIRVVSGILVFLFFKLTQESHWTDFFIWPLTTFVFLAYTVAVFLVIWEVATYSIKHFKNRGSFHSNKGFFRVFFKPAFSMLPFVVLFSYIFDFFIQPMCCRIDPSTCGNMYEDLDSVSQFWIHSAQGFVFSLLIISSDTINLYIKFAVNTAREKELIQKELIAAKFEGLKNQVNPHFLFNSFSVLTSLVENDPGKAVKFIAKLSDMYRYILENDETDLVTVETEIAFLEDYQFLLKMRHQEGILIENRIELDGEQVMVPPMSLQLLVENAVKHNAFSPTEPLHIQLYNEGNQFLVVENLKKPKQELVKSTGIGLKNLSKRLLLSIKRGLEITENAKEFRVKLPI
ncbi:MAG: histidine kinase [Cyclobacteriaceae bacterium]